MSRKPRFNLPRVPQHIIQRGHNREPCFFPKKITTVIYMISMKQR